MLTVPKSIRVEPCTSELLIMFAKSNKNNKNSPVRSEIAGKGQIEKTSAKKAWVLSPFPQIPQVLFSLPLSNFRAVPAIWESGTLNKNFGGNVGHASSPENEIHCKIKQGTEYRRATCRLYCASVVSFIKTRKTLIRSFVQSVAWWIFQRRSRYSLILRKIITFLIRSRRMFVTSFSDWTVRV